MKKKNLSNTNSEEGLCFECKTGCIKCCSIPGFIFVHEREIAGMAEFFKMPEDAFMDKYIKHYYGEVFRINCPENDPCMFLTDEGCEIYPVRPVQCRSFPFWPENVNNKKNWDKLKKMCPGIGAGRLYTIDEIIDIMAEVSYGPFMM